MNLSTFFGAHWVEIAATLNEGDPTDHIVVSGHTKLEIYRFGDYFLAVDHGATNSYIAVVVRQLCNDRNCVHIKSGPHTHGKSYMSSEKPEFADFLQEIKALIAEVGLQQ